MCIPDYSSQGEAKLCAFYHFMKPLSWGVLDDNKKRKYGNGHYPFHSPFLYLSSLAILFLPYQKVVFNDLSDLWWIFL